jgi:hypothetical protein
LNHSTAQALTNPTDALKPSSTFPSVLEEKAENSQQQAQSFEAEQELELAYSSVSCQWVTYSNGYTEYICYYY